MVWEPEDTVTLVIIVSPQSQLDLDLGFRGPDLGLGLTFQSFCVQCVGNFLNFVKHPLLFSFDHI